MRIIVDAMGGDHAPDEIVRGALLAKKEYGFEIILVGDEEKIRPLVLDEEVTVVHTAEAVTMEDDPTTTLRAKKDASMYVALRMLAQGEGDAVVSAGNTGALLVGATMLVKRIKGIRRAALALPMPTATGKCMLVDCGANVECTPAYLQQFALMGAYYAERVLKIENPRVALLNNGTEEHKGRTLEKETNALLKTAVKNYVGNMEAREVVLGGCDVIVTDGFTGNVLLKTVEGAGLFFGGMIKGMLKKNLFTKLSALVLKDGIRTLKSKMDYNETGGTPIMGLRGAVIKAHGSAKATAMKNAIRVAAEYVNTGIIDDITRDIASLSIDAED
ncbi:MAG: phosphate acyltransferase PlsX [Oscillospiraceae bacterium]|nr:phosphate acyltransferase PlsX [Oscillospiraceae bacterium]